MHPCNRGETLTRSVQENAAKRTVATRIRAQVCERPELFIGLGACDNWRGLRKQFSGERALSPVAAVSEQMLVSGFCVRCDSRLKRNTMIGPGHFRGGTCADLFRPFGVLVVWVLIRQD